MWRILVVVGLLGCHEHRSQRSLVPDASCAEGTRVLVFGAVNNPGPIVCRAGMHLGDALAAAGGLTPLAWRSHIRLKRGTRTYIVPYDPLRAGDTPDPMLGADDEIFVGERDV